MGRYAPPLPDSYLRPWDATGISFFEIDYPTIRGSQRTVRMMRSIGLESTEPPAEFYEYARQRAEDMPVWPAEGSMVYESGLVIVKLSEEKGLE